MTGFRVTPDTTPVLQAGAEPHSGAAGEQSSAGPPEQGLRTGQSKALLVRGEDVCGTCSGAGGTGHEETAVPVSEQWVGD